MRILVATLLTMATMLMVLALSLSIGGAFTITPSPTPERLYDSTVLALLWAIAIFEFTAALVRG
mgnify:FL=1